MDRVKRLWRRVENVVKMRNCATKNSRTNSIKGGGGECRNPLKKMVEYLCGGRVVGDKDRSRSFKV